MTTFCTVHDPVFHLVGLYVFCRACGRRRDLTNQELHAYHLLGRLPDLDGDRNA